MHEHAANRQPTGLLKCDLEVPLALAGPRAFSRSTDLATPGGFTRLELREGGAWGIGGLAAGHVTGVTAPSALRLLGVVTGANANRANVIEAAGASDGANAAEAPIVRVELELRWQQVALKETRLRVLIGLGCAPAGIRNARDAWRRWLANLKHAVEHGTTLCGDALTAAARAVGEPRTPAGPPSVDGGN